MILTYSKQKTFRQGNENVKLNTEQNYYKDGRSAKRMSSFLMDSPTRLSPKDDDWFYQNPISDANYINQCQGAETSYYQSNIEEMAG